MIAIVGIAALVAAGLIIVTNLPSGESQYGYRRELPDELDEEED